jgi:hypothetical protein
MLNRRGFDMQNEIWVLTKNLKALEKKVAKLERKAATLECDMPSIVITDETKLSALKSKTNLSFISTLVSYTKVLLSGNAPVLGEWILMAKLSHKKTANGYENVVNQIANIDDDITLMQQESTHNKKPHCDHCESYRYRKTTFLLKHQDTKEVIQVGSSCIDDFNGSSSLSHVMHYFSAIESLYTYRASTQTSNLQSEYGYAAVSLEDFVKVVGLTIDKYGFVSKNDALQAGYERDIHEVTTAHRIHSILNGHSDECDINYLSNEAISNYDASEVLHYLTVEMPSNRINEFTFNVLNAIESGYINAENRYHIAIVAAAIGGLFRKKEKEKEKLAEKKKFSDSHFGLLGQRSTYTLTFLEEDTASSEHGVGIILYFKDNENRRFKWTCWGDLPDIEFIKGKVYSIKGTISKHDTYGIPTTVINRCRDVCFAESEEGKDLKKAV